MRKKVFPRKQLHLTPQFILQSFFNILTTRGDVNDKQVRKKAFQALETFWRTQLLNVNMMGHEPLITFSVRTTFDCFLRAFVDNTSRPFICLSAVNIHDMARVIIENRFIPIPIDLDENTFAPKIEIFQRVIELVGGKKIGCLLLAHLFGSEIPSTIVQQFADLCHQHNIALVEDCAQAFSGVNGFLGNPESHLKMFSFGSIKSAGTFSGAMSFLNVAKCDHLVKSGLNSFEHFKSVHHQLDIQSTSALLKKMTKITIAYIIMLPRFFAICAYITSLMKSDMDQLLRSISRGFDPNGLLLPQIRLQPNTHLVHMMYNRFSKFAQSYKQNAADNILLRAQIGQYASSILPIQTSSPPPIPKSLGGGAIPVATNEDEGRMIVQPARKSDGHTYWLFPVFVEDSNYYIQRLQKLGFDATVGASHLAAISIPCANEYTKLGLSAPSDLSVLTADVRRELQTQCAQELMTRILYLPIYGEMDRRDALFLVSTLTELIRQKKRESKFPESLLIPSRL